MYKSIALVIVILLSGCDMSHNVTDPAVALERCLSSIRGASATQRATILMGRESCDYLRHTDTSEVYW